MTKKRRKSPRGKPTTDLVKSAHTHGENSRLFADLARLHIPPHSKVADVTYGKGVFWQEIPEGTYDVFTSDIDAAVIANNPIANLRHLPGVDCRELPYADVSFDAVILDPPYMEGFYRRAEEQLAGQGTHTPFRESYANGDLHDPNEIDAPRYHDAVIDMYLKAAQEAWRILRPGGVLVVKCQDEVSAGRQRFAHVEIMTGLEDMGFYSRDLFILVRTNAPGVSVILQQKHARKNHSYFLVFEKPKGKARKISNRRKAPPASSKASA